MASLKELLSQAAKLNPYSKEWYDFWINNISKLETKRLATAWEVTGSRLDKTMDTSVSVPPILSVDDWAILRQKVAGNDKYNLLQSDIDRIQSGGKVSPEIANNFRILLKDYVSSNEFKQKIESKTKEKKAEEESKVEEDKKKLFRDILQSLAAGEWMGDPTDTKGKEIFEKYKTQFSPESFKYEETPEGKYLATTYKDMMEENKKLLARNLAARGIQDSGIAERNILQLGQQQQQQQQAVKASDIAKQYAQWQAENQAKLGQLASAYGLSSDEYKNYINEYYNQLSLQSQLAQNQYLQEAARMQQQWDDLSKWLSLGGAGLNLAGGFLGVMGNIPKVG